MLHAGPPPAAQAPARGRRHGVPPAEPYSQRSGAREAARLAHCLGAARCRGGQSDWPIQTSAANACTDDTANHYIAVSSAIGVRWLIIARAVGAMHDFRGAFWFRRSGRGNTPIRHVPGTQVSIQDEVLRSLRTWPGYSGTSFVRTSVRTSAVRMTRDEVSHTRAVSYCYADCCGAFRGKVKRRFACNYPRAWQLRSKVRAALL
eukprot:COSAG06_NODE_1987_length_7906_cov_36.391315_13_plen_204_part_00